MHTHTHHIYTPHTPRTLRTSLQHLPNKLSVDILPMGSAWLQYFAGIIGAVVGTQVKK